METFNRKVNHFIHDFRQNIPPQYNQCNLILELNNDDIDHYMSISNRTDGKTFNYLNFFVQLSYRFGIGFNIVVRRWSNRNDYKTTLESIVDTFKFYKKKRIGFVNSQHYIKVILDDKVIGIISDLGSVTELKHASNFLKDFPIMILDEFLALDTDYLIDETERLKTLYESVNRQVEEIPYIKFPKIFYLGNAVNFNSPILSFLKMFNILENHKINTSNIYGNVFLEMRKNEHANERRNLRAFNSDDDSMTTGEFKTNKYQLATSEQIERIKYNNTIVIVKLDYHFLKIYHNPKTQDTILEIVGYSEQYDYNLNLVDNIDDSIYLKESYHDDEHYLKYNNEYFIFMNQYSKDYILSNTEYKSIKILKLIGQKELKNDSLPSFDRNTVEYERAYIEQTKRNIFKKFIYNE